MLELALYSVAFLLLCIASYSDIRTREVPDWVNFSGIIFGFSARLLWSVQTGEWSVLGWGALGFLVFFGLACVMFYTGQWGGGDSKILMALGALFGFAFSLDAFWLTFLAWCLLAGAGYGVIWSAWLAIKHWKDFSREYSLLARKLRWAHLPAWSVLLLGFGFAIASDDETFRILMLIVALLVPVLFYLALTVKAVEHACMYKLLAPDKLTEGDWIAKEIHHKGKYLCGPKDLGITKTQIQELKKLKIKNVLVKEGIPFAPTFLIAFALALACGSPLAWFI
jgi:Flp pilus assembly protein protease CpaA